MGRIWGDEGGVTQRSLPAAANVTGDTLGSGITARAHSPYVLMREQMLAKLCERSVIFGNVTLPDILYQRKPTSLPQH